LRRQTASDRRKIATNLAELNLTAHPIPAPAYAFISEGRWVANCDECNGAEFVTEEQPMVCGTCGAVSQVIWPDDVDGIEAVLVKRPKVVNRNYLPGETVALLKAENKMHGVD
jgi:hypothetical protein